MIRIFSTFAMAGWTGFHAVSAAMTLPAAATGPLMAAGHAVLAILFLAVAAALQAPGSSRGRDFAGLLALGAGLGLAVAAGTGAEAPGAYAAAVASTLLGLAFDRRFGMANEEDEVDHDAFMREAALLGARMGREAPEPRKAPIA